ncbi:MAG: hypothetical protein LBC41_02970 [Clostridiales bacterium]|nr:hypothetical protein [Clostridiales bacterium]MDR2749600.1 hypothetical protein [Clostridiales bacterium]
MNFKKATKPELIVTSCVLLWIFIVNVACVMFGIVSWPMFFVTIIFFLLGMDQKNILSIFCGGALGLVLALLLALGLGVFGAGLGSFAILIFIELAIIILGGTVAPVCCNNIAFAYLTAATINLGTSANPIGDMLNNLLVFIVGGAIILAGSLFALKIGMKIVTPKAPAAQEQK